MKKLFYAAASVCLLAGAIGCSDDYDDSALWDKMNGIDGDIENIKTDLEALKVKVEGLNETYKGIAALLNAGMITGVQEVSDAGRTGYKFTVTTVATDGTTTHSEYTIWNGTDGQDGEAGADGADGTTPQLGVAKDEATGRYYWTVTIGEETTDLTDAEGNKIWATGEAGADGEDGAPGAPGTNGTNGTNGVTPQLKIGESTTNPGTNAWFVSYDNGTSWTELGTFSGDVQSSSIQVNVNEDKTVVTILQDGKDPIEIPIVEANNIQITFAGVDAAGKHMKPGEVFEAVYTIEGATENAVVKAEMLNGDAFWVENVPAEKKIKISAEEGVSASDVVLVHVYDGKVCYHTSFTVISDIATASIAQTDMTLPVSYTAEGNFVYSGRVTLDIPAAEELTFAVTAGETTLPEGYTLGNATIAKGATEGAYTVTIPRNTLVESTQYDLALTVASESDMAVLADGGVNIHITGEVSKITLTADMLESIYTGENSMAELCDGVLTNHWGSNYWDSCPAGDPTYGVYIDIKLPAALRSVKFRYYTRHNNSNAVPTEIKVGVSNDKTAWTELFMANTGLPTANAAWWEGDTMHDAAESFSYIRFGITKSALGDLVANAKASTALTELEVYGLY